MGVAGSGKSTVGCRLSTRTGIPFCDGDDFHPKTNIEKMSNGQALTDADRAGWLEAIRLFVLKKIMVSHLIIACSALKECYRQQLMQEMEGRCDWVVLTGSYELLLERLTARKGHFMPPTLLLSQLDTLELPSYGFNIEINQPVEAIVDQVVGWLELPQ